MRSIVSLCRLRVPIGVALILAMQIVICSQVALATPPPPDRLVVSCDSARSGWTCDLAIDGVPTTSTTIELANCFVSRQVTVPPSGVAIAEDFGSWRCGAPIHLANMGRAPASLATMARSPNGMTLTFPSISSYAVISSQQWVRAAPVRNVAGGDATFLAAWNLSLTERADITIRIRDDGGETIAYEHTSIEPDGFLFYEIATPVAAASVELLGGWLGIGPTSVGQAYAYVVTGARTGATAPRVMVPYPVVSNQ